jgi:hypothetical protein
MSGIDGNGDGARVRAKRRAQAEFLANLVQARQASDPQEAIAVVGNFNAFEFNDGYVDMLGTIEGRPTLSGNVVLASADLVSPNLSDLVQEVARAGRYSFSLEGSAQTLDHVLVDTPLLSRSTGLAFARNGADFPESFRNDPARPERVSSHDMPVAYFRFGNLAVEPIPGPGLSGPIAIPNPMRERCELRFALDCGGGRATDRLRHPPDAASWSWPEATARPVRTCCDGMAGTGRARA